MKIKSKFFTILSSISFATVAITIPSIFLVGKASSVQTTIQSDLKAFENNVPVLTKTQRDINQLLRPRGNSYLKLAQPIDGANYCLPLSARAEATAFAGAINAVNAHPKLRLKMYQSTAECPGAPWRLEWVDSLPGTFVGYNYTTEANNLITGSVIKLKKPYYEKLTASKKLSLILHEIGHSLSFNNVTWNGMDSIMTDGTALDGQNHIRTDLSYWDTLALNRIYP